MSGHGSDDMSIVLAGVSHRQTPLEVRERLFFEADGIGEWLDRLAGYDGLTERLILSTCNRIEVYTCCPNYEAGVTAIERFLVESRGVPSEELRRHLYVLRDEEAMRHLFLVASSLDSMVVGEPQILGQVKDAYRIAQESGHTGKILTHLFSRAFRVAKRIREGTSVGEAPVSVSSVAVDLAKRIFGSLEDRTVLLIGAGEMGELAVRHLIAQGASDLLVANRTFSRGRELASSLGGRAVDFENLRAEMAGADIVITSTGAPHFIVDKEIVTAALEARRDQPIFFIDIAVPRDVDPVVNDLENVFLYDVDDLQAVVADNLKGREEEAAQARRIVEEELDAYIRRRQTEGLSRAFAAIRVQAEDYRRGEVEKTLSRLSGLGDAERKSIEAMSRAIVNKLLHRPFEVLRQLADEDLGAESLSVALRLFGIFEEQASSSPPAPTDENDENDEEGAGPPERGA